METNIYQDDQYEINTSLEIGHQDHAQNLLEIAYASLHKFFKETGLTPDEAGTRFEKFETKVKELNEEMLSEIKKL